MTPNVGSLKLPTRGYNAEFLSHLEVLEVARYALPGATVHRNNLAGDERLVIRDPKSSDLITFYEHWRR